MEHITANDEYALFIEKLKESQIKRQNELEKIIKTNDYMDWVENCLNRFPILIREVVAQSLDEYTEEDSNNVEKLEYLFSAVKEYANRIFVPWVSHEFGGCYYIRYNNQCYSIGVMSGQGTDFYIGKIGNTENAIDFESIKNNVLPENAKLFAQKLDDLERYIVESGIPSQILQTRFDKIILRLEK